MFLIIKQRDAQGNLVRVHVPIPFKQLRELKTACSQYGPTAPFTHRLLENMALEALPPQGGLETDDQSLPVRRILPVVED